jgi:hypothetical protein
MNNLIRTAGRQQKSPRLIQLISSSSSNRSALAQCTTLPTNNNEPLAQHQKTIARTASSYPEPSIPRAAYDDEEIEQGAPTGDLFDAAINQHLLHKSASLKRTFTPRSNAQALLTCGGPILAAHASFDPKFDRARAYIRTHAVGPAVLSPVLIYGLLGALVEASLPQSFMMGSTLKQHCPLIVGVQVEATIKVISVVEGDGSRDGNGKEASAISFAKTSAGFDLVLETEVKRVSDGTIIADGTQKVWLPDYNR